jgi:PAS domain S-box-containing protein
MSADGSPDRTEGAWVLDAVGGLSEALLVVDSRGELVICNAAARKIARLRGAPSASPEGFGVFHPDERTPLTPDELPILRALKGIESRDVRLFVRNDLVPHGLHMLASSSPVRDASGQIRGAVSIWRDFTRIREQELQLQESARQKRAILDNIPDMAWLKDRDSRYLHVNHRIVELVGRRSADELVGLTDHDLFPAHIAERYRADDQVVMESGSTIRVEEPFYDASGTQQGWIETIKTRIVDDDGVVIGTTGIARDITERRRAEELLRSAKDELERRFHARTEELAEAQENLVRQERLAILGQLAGGVAHQIRNPLAAIMNATYVLRRHIAPGQHPNVEDALHIIHDEVRHANTIITGLLDYARVRTPDRHPTSIVDVLERILVAEWIPESVCITRTLPDDDPVVCNVDADQLQGAIANLVRNAVEAMPDGGELTVGLRVEAGDVLIRISDTGPGISPQVRTHLFEPLHSTKPSGIGLGLVTARRFVEAHDGSIALVEATRGTSFEVRLPIS